jgi:hypothetical protein
MSNPNPMSQPQPQPAPPSHPKEITYEVDGEPQTTTERVLTPLQILTNAGIDPATHYLKLLRGESDQEHSYKDEMETPIQMHPHMRFLAPSIGPTPVS